MLYPVIMAGGVATRLWPESRRKLPKQLMPLMDGRSMLRATIDRISPLAPAERILIATTAELAEAISLDLGESAQISMLLEPMPRNTGPCIGLAAVQLLAHDPDATMLILPADHVIEPTEAFVDAVRWAETLVDRGPWRLITFGVRPTSPATGFGYIERGESFDAGDAKSAAETPPQTFQVAHFKEKPDAAMAQAYVDDGRYYWNAGIFVWKAQTVLDLIGRFEPEVHASLMRIANAIHQPDHRETLRFEFATIKSISIDYAVMERAEDVLVVESPFTWDDVGSWQSLERHIDADPAGNVIDAARSSLADARNNLVRCKTSDKIVVLEGVDGLLVVDTPDALMIARRDDETAVRRIVERLREDGFDDVI